MNASIFLPSYLVVPSSETKSFQADLSNLYQNEILSADVQLTVTLNMTTAQVVENVNNNRQQQKSDSGQHRPGRKHSADLLMK